MPNTLKAHLQEMGLNRHNGNVLIVVIHVIIIVFGL